MQSLSIKKQYSIATLIQVVALTLFFVVTKLMLNNENVVLNPIPYFIAVWVFICAINGIVLIVFVFRGETLPSNIDIEKDGE